MPSQNTSPRVLKTDPEALHEAPITTPVRRVDEVYARNLCLRHPFDELEDGGRIIHRHQARPFCGMNSLMDGNAKPSSDYTITLFAFFMGFASGWVHVHDGVVFDRFATAP